MTNLVVAILAVASAVEVVIAVVTVRAITAVPSTSDIKRNTKRIERQLECSTSLTTTVTFFMSSLGHWKTWSIVSSGSLHPGHWVTPVIYPLLCITGNQSCINLHVCFFMLWSYFCITRAAFSIALPSMAKLVTSDANLSRMPH